MAERLALKKANGKAADGEPAAKPNGKTTLPAVVTSLVPLPPRVVTKYRPEYAKIALEVCRLGATNNDLARLFEVNETTINTWQHTYADFEEATRIGKEETDARVERSLLQRACGYWLRGERQYLVDDVRHEFDKQGKVTASLTTKKVLRVEVLEYVHPDTTAQIFWLKNRKPNEWREKAPGDITSPFAGPITPETAQRIFSDRIDSVTARLRETEVEVRTKR